MIRGDDKRGVLAEAVEDDAQGLRADFIRVERDLNGALGGGEGFVAGEEAEALGLIGKEHGAEIAVAEADLTVFGDGTGNAERLQADTDRGSRVGRLLAAGLQRDRRADGVCPNGVFKADGLRLRTILSQSMPAAR